MGVIRTNSGARSLGKRRYLPIVFYFIGVTILLFGLSRPEMEISLPHIEGTVILALDVSSSMNADDLDPTRIEAARNAAKTFVENQPSTVLVGVVAFSSGGLVVNPPTAEPTDLYETLDRLTTQGGTSLSQGIFSSLNAIAGESIGFAEETVEGEPPQIEIGYYPSTVILLLTDGENTEGPDPLEIAQVAAEAGVRIFPVGIGSKEGTVLEVEGFQVLTQLDESLLQDIASLTNGQYYHADNEEALQEIYDTIDLQLTIKGEKMEITSIVAGAGLLFLLIGSAFSLILFGRMP